MHDYQHKKQANVIKYMYSEVVRVCEFTINLLVYNAKLSVLISAHLSDTESKFFLPLCRAHSVQYCGSYHGPQKERVLGT